MERATLAGETSSVVRSLRQHVGEWEARALSATRMFESANDAGAMIAWHTRAQYANMMAKDWRERLRELTD